MAERRFEGCGGLVLTEEIEIAILAHAALLLLGGHDNDYWADVSTILVYPTSFQLPSPRSRADVPPWERSPRVGEAWPHGPVILSWDSVTNDIARPESGRSVVLHEFAHRIDMENGVVDGVPPLLRRVAPATWQSIMKPEFDALTAASKRGAATLLDEYGATSPGEFFAVATECFFTRPRELEDRHPSLFAALRAWYRQDPAERPEPVGRPWNEVAGLATPSA